MQTIAREIEDLHDNVVLWITGTCPEDDETFDQRIARRFADDFTLVSPGGRQLQAGDFLAGMRSQHGANPAFEMTITDVHVVAESDACIAATCVNNQRNAKLSASENRRAMTVIFARDPSKPDGLRWLHAQETLLVAST